MKSVPDGKNARTERLCTICRSGGIFRLPTARKAFCAGMGKPVGGMPFIGLYQKN